MALLSALDLRDRVRLLGGRQTRTGGNARIVRSDESAAGVHVFAEPRRPASVSMDSRADQRGAGAASLPAHQVERLGGNLAQPVPHNTARPADTDAGGGV